MEGYYKFVELDKWNGKFHLKERSFRNLQRFEILIRVYCTTIHNSDIDFIKGIYGDEKPDIFPVIPGFEGSGEIVKVGEDIDRKYVGKRVGVIADGSKHGCFEGLWAEYHYTTLPNVFIFDQYIPFEKICFMINPLAALGLLDTLKKQQVKSIIQSNAGSPIGKIIAKLCKRENIECINFVKDEKGLNEMKLINAKNIIKCENGWESSLNKLSNQLKTNVCFDCVGGEYTGKILNNLPNGALLYLYGSLHEKEITKLLSEDLIFKNKTIEGWWLKTWLLSLSQQEMDYYFNYIRNEMASDSNLFYSDITEYYKLNDIDKALFFFTSNKGDCKVIIRTG